jgi:hypothetical protein
VAFFAANTGGVDEQRMTSTFRLTNSAAMFAQPCRLLCKAVFHLEILPLNPAEPAYLLSERVYSTCASSACAWIKVAYSNNFSRLLRRSGQAQRKEHSARSKPKDFPSH